jgi:hypothetical protein
MSDEQDKLKLSLEAPKLFGRKKKPGATAAPAPAPAPAAPEVELPAVTEDAAADPVTDDNVTEDTVTDDTATDEVVAPEPTAVLEEIAVQPAPRAQAPKPAPKPAPKAAPKPAAVHVVPEPVKASSADLEDAEIAALAASGPLLGSYRAAALTGLVVGAAMVVLTWLSLRGCEAIRGTASCGGGPGFLLLVATFALCVLLGAQLLKAFSISEPGSSSFLAVGLVAVVALLFLVQYLDHWSMLIVVPLLSIGAHLVSIWVTKTFVDPADG